MKEQFFGDWNWLESVLEMSNTGLWSMIIDEKTGKNYMYAGNVMLRLLGLTAHPSPEECYTHWNERIEEKYRNQVKHGVDEMLHTGKFLEIQYRWKHPWWGNIFIRCGGRAETLPDGRIQIKGYHQNINELEVLKQENRLQYAEIEEIKQQKKNYDELFDSVLCGIITYKKENLKFVFKKINKEALRIFHYEEEEFWKKDEWDITDLIDKEDIPCFQDTMKGLKNIGDMVSRELRLITKEGETVWIIEKTDLIMDNDGDEVYRSVFIDNNENKKKAVLLDEIAENIPGGVCLIDVNSFSVLYGNEGFYDLYGCTEEELRDNYKRSIVSFVRRVDRKRIQKIVTEAILSDQRSVEFELPIQRRDERKMWVLVKGTLINSLGSRQLNCVLIDITARKNIEKELYLNERRLSIALEQTENIVFDFDIRTGRALMKSGNLGTMVPAGIVDNAVENLVTLGILHKDYQKVFQEMWDEVANGSEKVSKELLVRYKKGAPFVWTKAVLRTIYTENGVPLRAVGILEDISLQKAAELAFIKEEKYRQAMLAEMIASAEINVTRNTIEKTSGDWEMEKQEQELSYDEILEKMLEKEIFSEDRERYLSAVSREAFLTAHMKGETEINCEYRRVDLEDKVRWVRLTAHLLREPISGDLKVLTYLKDIDSKKRSEIKMKYQSERDSLTGLYNKGTAKELTKKFLLGEMGKNVHHAFIIMDLDHFKSMNDTFGHQYGDEVLEKTAAVLKETFRADDIVGRLGGDEMVVLMKNVPSRECVEEKLRLIKTRLKELKREDRCVTASIGVSFFNEDGNSYDELYHTADIALYQAKESSRDCYVIYDKSMETESV